MADQLTDDLLSFDPLTGEERVLPLDYPGLPDNTLAGDIGWGEFDHSLRLFDAQASRVIYPVSFGTLALAGAADGTVIQVLNHTINTRTRPAWSPDGQRFLVAGRPDIDGEEDFYGYWTELFEVTRDGQTRRLTYFNVDYGPSQYGPYAWSPHGHYAAIGHLLEPSDYPDIYPMSNTMVGETYRLEIVDLWADRYIWTCIPNTTLARPVWSPNGSAVIFEDNFSATKNNVFLYDLEAQRAYRLPDNATPIGWLAAPP